MERVWYGIHRVLIIISHPTHTHGWFWNCNPHLPLIRGSRSYNHDTSTINANIYRLNENPSRSPSKDKSYSPFSFLLQQRYPSVFFNQIMHIIKAALASQGRYINIPSVITQVGFENGNVYAILPLCCEGKEVAFDRSSGSSKA